MSATVEPSLPEVVLARKIWRRRLGYSRLKRKLHPYSAAPRWTSFQLYTNAEYPNVEAALKQTDPRTTPKDVHKVMGAQWRALDQTRKRSFSTQARTAKRMKTSPAVDRHVTINSVNKLIKDGNGVGLHSLAIHIGVDHDEAGSPTVERHFNASNVDLGRAVLRRFPGLLDFITAFVVNQERNSATTGSTSTSTQPAAAESASTQSPTTVSVSIRPSGAGAASTHPSTSSQTTNAESAACASNRPVPVESASTQSASTRSTVRDSTSGQPTDTGSASNRPAPAESASAQPTHAESASTRSTSTDSALAQPTESAVIPPTTLPLPVAAATRSATETFLFSVTCPVNPLTLSVGELREIAKCSVLNSLSLRFGYLGNLTSDIKQGVTISVLWSESQPIIPVSLGQFIAADKAFLLRLLDKPLWMMISPSVLQKLRQHIARPIPVGTLPSGGLNVRNWQSGMRYLPNLTNCCWIMAAVGFLATIPPVLRAVLDCSASSAPLMCAAICAPIKLLDQYLSRGFNGSPAQLASLNAVASQLEEAVRACPSFRTQMNTPKGQIGEAETLVGIVLSELLDKDRDLLVIETSQVRQECQPTCSAPVSGAGRRKKELEYVLNLRPCNVESLTSSLFKLHTNDQHREQCNVIQTQTSLPLGRVLFMQAPHALEHSTRFSRGAFPSQYKIPTEIQTPSDARYQLCSMLLYKHSPYRHFWAGVVDPSKHRYAFFMDSLTQNITAARLDSIASDKVSMLAYQRVE